MEQEKLQYKINPLLDIKTIRDEYKINTPTIKSILANDKTPVVWLGNKRYLRQSDLEQYIDDNTKGLSTVATSLDTKEPTAIVSSKANSTTTKPKAQKNKLTSMMAEPKYTSNKTNDTLDMLFGALKNSKQ